jgi:WD40 repeat protein
MELVRGVSITDYCDQHSLTLRERLELFVPVCRAVQHAHQKGIIHRDLKPSNILVTRNDGVPVPKVIDFGIAKALGQQLTDKTLYTGFAQLVGTPMYMSPEQADLTAVDIDTRTDIYALGVLLYELLTGTTPFDKERLRTVGYDELRRIVREEEPPKPSTRLSTLGLAATTISAQRQSDPKRLSQLFRRELDWIVMKALEKDRSRRYETAAAFAADVERYLHDEPVEACPPSAAYRLRKFARKYGKLLATAAAFVALLLTVAVVALVGAGRLNVQLNLTREAKDEATKELYHSLVVQARASRQSRRPGQRFDSLKAVQQAARIAQELHLPEKDFLDLRTEAIACLLLPDFEVAKEWDGWPVGSGGLAFDAALERYARGDKDGNVSIRRVADDQELLTLPGAGWVDPYDGLMFSPNGRFLHQRCRTAHGWRSRVWKLDETRPVALLDDDHCGFAFSPDGREWAAYYPEGSLRVCDASSGKELRGWRLDFPHDRPCLAWNPRRPLLVAFSRSRPVWVVNTGTGRVEWEIPMPGENAWADWHPEGRLLAVSLDSERKIRLWDIDTRQLVLSPLKGHKTGGIILRFDPSGERLVSNDWSGIWRLWDVQTGQQLLAVPAGGNCLQFNATGTLAAASASPPRLQMFRYRSGLEFRTLIPRRGPGMGDAMAWWHVALDPGGRLLAVTVKDSLCLLDIARGEDFALLPVAMNTPVAFEPSGALLTSGVSGLLRLPVAVDPATNRRRYGPPERLYPSTTYDRHGASADGRVLAIPNYSRGAIVLHRDGNRTIPLGPQEDVRYCAVSPDRSWVATGSHSLHEGAGAKVWDARTGAPKADLPAAGLCLVAFSPDGKWLATGGGGVRLWEVGTWRPGPVVSGPNHTSFAFACDSRLIAVQDDPGIVRLVVPETGKELARLTAPVDTPLMPRCFTPDGMQLITQGGDQAIHIFDLAAIRRQLREIGLDWDPLLDPAPPPHLERPRPLQVEVDLGDLASPKPEEQARQTIAHYRQVLEGKPDDPLACNNLAWAYLTAPAALRDAKAALPLAEKAVALALENTLYRGTLGLAYYRLGRFREAVDTLRPNLQRQEDGALAFDLYGLAMAYHRLGEAERAQDCWIWAARWSQVEKGLSAEQLEELGACRAEAAEVLGVKEENPNPKDTQNPKVPKPGDDGPKRKAAGAAPPPR